MAARPRTTELKHLPPDQIRRNPENPRLVFRQDEMESLLTSIAKHGIQVPLAVYRDGSHYTLLDGERRWRCAMKLNLPTVPVLVQVRPSELENLVLMYNIHALREQWDYFTIASKLARVVDLFTKENSHKPTEDDLADLTGLSRGQIRRCRLLLDLPQRFKDMLLEELELPKTQQKLSEDLFIEMERALKTVTKRMPEYSPRIDKIRDVLIKKFKDETIKAVTDFRQLSKIATAIGRPGVQEARARRALDRIFTIGNHDGIREAYSRTVEFAYDERKAARYVAELIEYLQHSIQAGSTPRFDEHFVAQLHELMRWLRKLEKSGK